MAAMTGAEFKTILGALGLPPSWFAERMGVTMRTVVRWFDGDEVTERVAEEIRELESTTLAMMREVMSNAAVSRGGITMLHTYRTDTDIHDAMPASWHRQLTFRVMEHLKAQGKKVSVEYQ